jgi:hypothetical protein
MYRFTVIMNWEGVKAGSKHGVQVRALQSISTSCNDATTTKEDNNRYKGLGYKLQPRRKKFEQIRLKAVWAMHQEELHDKILARACTRARVFPEWWSAEERQSSSSSSQSWTSALLHITHWRMWMVRRNRLSRSCGVIVSLVGRFIA